MKISTWIISFLTILLFIPSFTFAQATATAQVTVSPIQICNDGQQRPEQTPQGDSIQQCQNNMWVTIQTCNSGENAISNPNGVGFQCVNVTAQSYQSTLTVFGIIIVILIGVISVLFYKFRKKKRR